MTKPWAWLIGALEIAGLLWVLAPYAPEWAFFVGLIVFFGAVFMAVVAASNEAA